jgi:hypothetical protein
MTFLAWRAKANSSQDDPDAMGRAVVCQRDPRLISGRETLGVLFEPLDAEKFRTDRIVMDPTGSRRPRHRGLTAQPIK